MKKYFLLSMALALLMLGCSKTEEEVVTKETVAAGTLLHFEMDEPYYHVNQDCDKIIDKESIYHCFLALAEKNMLKPCDSCIEIN